MVLDPMYFILVGPAILLALIAQGMVKGTFSKYSKVAPRSGMTGAEAASEMLRAAGLYGRVDIERVSGFLSDHYDPRKKVLRLSPEVHDGRSLASVGVACHEVGHAIQDAQAYKPLVLRNAIVPLAGFGSNFAFILIFLGMIIGALKLAAVGVVLFGAVVVFQIINLPVEFNASSRAKRMVVQLGIVQQGGEAAAVGRVLNAAAMTYVAATVVALMQLIHFALIVFGGRRD